VAPYRGYGAAKNFMTISDGHPQDLATVTTAGLAPIHNSTPDLLLSLPRYYDLQLRALHASIVVVTVMQYCSPDLECQLLHQNTNPPALT